MVTRLFARWSLMDSCPVVAVAAHQIRGSFVPCGLILVSTCVARCCVFVGYSLRTLATLSYRSRLWLQSPCNNNNRLFAFPCVVCVAIARLYCRRVACVCRCLSAPVHRAIYHLHDFILFWLVLLSPSLCLSLIHVSSYQWLFWLWLYCSTAFFLVNDFFRFFSLFLFWSLSFLKWLYFLSHTHTITTLSYYI